ncbi:MAG: hypothetical protein AB8B96_02375 [Lysobacterales bacterium]
MLAVPVLADERRAKVNYMLNCQGCHQASAQGLADKVPRMNDFVGYFTRSEEGRKFLIQVPGSATAPVSDEELTELMNWILRTFSGEQLVDGFVPYTVSEVTQLRQHVEPNPADRREAILHELAKHDEDLASKLP